MDRAAPSDPATGILTDDEKARMNAWIAAHWKADFHCPICQSTQWTILEHVIEFKPFAGGSVVVGGTSYPHIGIMSVPCGYTIFVNAIVAGVKILPPQAGQSDANPAS